MKHLQLAHRRPWGPRRILPAAMLAMASLPLGAATTQTMTISAVVLSKNVCKFNSTSSALNFGNINPTSASPVTASVTLSYRCNGSDPVATWSVSSDDGLYASGAGQPRMRHATLLTNFLPYTLTFPASGSAPRNTNLNMTVTGTILPASFSAAPAGAYSDTLILSILP